MNANKLEYFNANKPELQHVKDKPDKDKALMPNWLQKSSYIIWLQTASGTDLSQGRKGKCQP